MCRTPSAPTLDIPLLLIIYGGHKKDKPEKKEKRENRKRIRMIIIAEYNNYSIFSW
jgi:hypothetical protein